MSPAVSDLLFDPLELADVAVQMDGRHWASGGAEDQTSRLPSRPATTQPGKPPAIDYFGLIQKPPRRGTSAAARLPQPAPYASRPSVARCQGPDP